MRAARTADQAGALLRGGVAGGAAEGGAAQAYAELVVVGAAGQGHAAVLGALILALACDASWALLQASPVALTCEQVR
jgi:hypothetical protein